MKVAIIIIGILGVFILAAFRGYPPGGGQPIVPPSTGIVLVDPSSTLVLVDPSETLVLVTP
jgi:hypothetical protein